MRTFEDLHRERITGSLAMFDPMIFKGHLTRLYAQDGARCFLWSQGVALKDFTACAKSTTEHDGVTAGIVCLTSAVEPCFSFQVRTRHNTGRIELFRRERKCLHHYLYLIDDEFGFMHVRIQGWFHHPPRTAQDLA